MKHGVSRELFAYWDRLRKGRSAPERADIDPAAIRGVLSDTFILAAERKGDHSAFPIRLSGTRLNALFLTELKSRDLLGMWRDEERGAITRIFDSVLDDAAPLVAGLRGGPSEHRAIDLEMILLPLRHHGHTHMRILGAIAPIELPAWLGLLPIGRLTLTSLRLIDTPPHGPPMVVPFRSAGAVEHARSASAPRRYGRFVVHEGGR